MAKSCTHGHSRNGHNNGIAKATEIRPVAFSYGLSVLLVRAAAPCIKCMILAMAYLWIERKIAELFAYFYSLFLRKKTNGRIWKHTLDFLRAIFYNPFTYIISLDEY